MKSLPEETSISGEMSCKGNNQKTPLFISFIFSLGKKKKKNHNSQKMSALQKCLWQLPCTFKSSSMEEGSG